MATIAGATYGIKKLWDRHKAKKAETQVNVRKEEGTQLSTETACEVLSTETAKSNDAEPKSLTQEEAIQELMKILVGMAEIAAGKKKVSEGVENLSNAGIVDRMVLLKKLSDSQTLECLNAYLKNNPQFLMQNQTILDGYIWTQPYRGGAVHSAGCIGYRTATTNRNYSGGLTKMENGEQLTFEFEQRPTIKGFPELRWTGKRPYRSTQYYPAQLRETYGKEKNGWLNKIFWGDNLQVMSHLLKEYRGQVDLIYIDPPFDSKADYKKKIDLRGIERLKVIVLLLKKTVWRHLDK